MPSMNNVFVTIAPAIDALTRRYSPARSAVIAITSSVRLPSVAFSSPPTASPVLAATDSVAWLRSAASGTVASTDSTNSAVCDSGVMRSADEHDRHEDEQPQQLVVPDLREQEVQAVRTYSKMNDTNISRPSRWICMVTGVPGFERPHAVAQSVERGDAAVVHAADDVFRHDRHVAGVPLAARATTMMP